MLPISEIHTWCSWEAWRRRKASCDASLVLIATTQRHKEAYVVHLPAALLYLQTLAAHLLEILQAESQGILPVEQVLQRQQRVHSIQQATPFQQACLCLVQRLVWAERLLHLQVRWYLILPKGLPVEDRRLNRRRCVYRERLSDRECVFLLIRPLLGRCFQGQTGRLWLVFA